MFSGTLEAIYLATKPELPMQLLHEARVVPGRGLDGDRYFTGEGSFTEPGNPDREITLIEIEAVEAASSEHNLELDVHETRRNLVTRDVPLNHLVGREFHVGDVRLRGIRLCEPCGHLEKLTRQGVRKSLVHRGGLRAQVLTEGFIHVGDPIK